MREEIDSGQFEATKAVLSEVASLLMEFEGVVVVGGNVPYLLLSQDAEPHEGTADVDLVLNINGFRSLGEHTFREALERHLFQQDIGPGGNRPYRYIKSVEFRGRTHHIVVELLSGGIPQPDGLLRIPSEDVHVSVIEGMEVALDRPLSTHVPGDPTLSLPVASIPSFLAMKASALEKRSISKKAKDAYDIVYCLRNYPGGVEALAAEFRERMNNPIVHGCVWLMGELFSDPQEVGPVAYGSRGQDKEEEALLGRQAYELVNDFLDLLR